MGVYDLDDDARRRSRCRYSKARTASPIGAQLIARHHDDRRLFDIALGLPAANPRISTWLNHLDRSLSRQLHVVERDAGHEGHGALRRGRAEEIDRVCQRLKARESEPQAAWWEEWCAMGARLNARRRRSTSWGMRRQRRAIFCAPAWTTTGERFIVPGEQKREVGRKAIELQTRGILPGATRTSRKWKCRTKTSRFRRSSCARPARRERRRPSCSSMAWTTARK